MKSIFLCGAFFFIGCAAVIITADVPKSGEPDKGGIKRYDLEGDKEKFGPVTDGHDLWVWKIEGQYVGIMHAPNCRKCKPKFD